MTLALRARRATGLSQREFAKLIGASYVTVAGWETGAQPPSRLTASLLRIVEAHPRLCGRVLKHAKVEDAAPPDELAKKLSETGRTPQDTRRLTDGGKPGRGPPHP